MAISNGKRISLGCDCGAYVDTQNASKMVENMRASDREGGIWSIVCGHCAAWLVFRGTSLRPITPVETAGCIWEATTSYWETRLEQFDVILRQWSVDSREDGSASLGSIRMIDTVKRWRERSKAKMFLEGR